MKSLDKLDARVNEMIKSREVFMKHFTRDDIVVYIDYLINNHKLIIESLTPFSNSNAGKMASALSDTRTAKKMGFGLYIEFRNRLINNASSMESKYVFRSILETNKIFLDLLRDLRDKVDEYFDKNTVNITNIKLSHVIIFGLFDMSLKTSTFSKNIFALVCNAYDGKMDTLPPYRVVYIEKYMDEMIGIVNTTIAKAGVNDYKGLIKIIKDSANNKNLLGPDNTSQVKSIMLKGGKDMDNMIMAGFTLTISRFIGENLNMFKRWLERERTTELEWMKARVELLQHKLNGMDSSDPEYIRLRKIISKYEEMINKRERKLQKRGK